MHAPEPTRVAEPLLRWYDAHKRDLPWRRTRDPYRIWVSEIMLQQTRVDTVIPYYHRFLQALPTVQALAAADGEQVRALWSGLGFYRRARNLHAGARFVVQELGGELPRDVEGLLRIPGVGRYTAGAIRSISFDLPAPILDGNLVRVLSRLFRVEGEPDRAAVQREFWRLAEAVLPAERPGDFNQALMDLGATVCSPTGPRCGGCPLQELCAARASGEAEDFPWPARRGRVRFERRAALHLRRADGALLLVRRPDEGLLAALWELPAVELAEAEAPEEGALRLAAALGHRGGLRPRGGVEHRFSHRHWTVAVFAGAGRGTEALPGRECRWVADEERGGLGLPTVSRRAIEAGDRAGGATTGR